MRRRLGLVVAFFLSFGAVASFVAVSGRLATLRLLHHPVLSAVPAAGPASQAGAFVLVRVQVVGPASSAGAQSADDAIAMVQGEKAVYEAFDRWYRPANRMEWYFDHRTSSARTFEAVDGAGTRVLVRSGNLPPIFSLPVREVLPQGLGSRLFHYYLLPGDRVIVGGCLTRDGAGATIATCHGHPLLLADAVGGLRADLREQVRSPLLLAGLLLVLAALVAGLTLGPRLRRAAVPSERAS